MGPRFTVLLPTHDRADVIGHAIRSVLAQTVADFELLVVGDGCTDETGSVVTAFMDPRIRWFDLPKAPHFGYANRNIALREARGDLVAFMAHDDLLLPDHLERLGSRFAASDVEWAYSRPVWVSDDGLLVPFAVDLRKPAQLAYFLEVANSIPASCVVYRRACHERYGYWPEDVRSSGDWELWRAILRPSGGANLAYLPTFTTLHFRADWRDRAAWGPAPLHRWLTVAADASRWPAALRVTLAAEGTSQGSIGRAIADDPEGWASATREAIAEAMDLLAWTQAFELYALDQALAAANTDLQQAAADVEAARADVVASRTDAVGARAGAEAARAGAETARADAVAALADAERWQGEAQSAQLTAERATAEAREAQELVRSLLSSSSWRVTAPLRRAKAALRR